MLSFSDSPWSTFLWFFARVCGRAKLRFLGVGHFEIKYISGGSGHSQPIIISVRKMWFHKMNTIGSFDRSVRHVWPTDGQTRLYRHWVECEKSYGPTKLIRADWSIKVGEKRLKGKQKDFCRPKTVWRVEHIVGLQKYRTEEFENEQKIYKQRTKWSIPEVEQLEYINSQKRNLEWIINKMMTIMTKCNNHKLTYFSQIRFVYPNNDIQ